MGQNYACALVTENFSLNCNLRPADVFELFVMAFDDSQIYAGNCNYCCQMVAEVELRVDCQHRKRRRSA